MVALGCSPEQKLNNKSNDPKAGLPSASGMRMGAKGTEPDKKPDTPPPTRSRTPPPTRSQTPLPTRSRTPLAEKKPDAAPDKKPEPKK